MDKTVAVFINVEIFMDNELVDHQTQISHYKSFEDACTRALVVIQRDVKHAINNNMTVKVANGNAMYEIISEKEGIRFITTVLIAGFQI